MTDNKKEIVRGICRITIFILASLLLGASFYFSESTFFDENIAKKIVQILMTSLALYFAVMSYAIKELKSLQNISEEIKKAATENDKLDRDSRLIFIDKANDIYASSKNMIDLTFKYLKREIWMIIVVIVFPCIKDVVIALSTQCSCHSCPCMMNIFGVINNTIVLFSIIYTLFIVLDTAKIINFLNKEL